MSADLVRRGRNRWPSALPSPQRFDSRPPISRRKRPCKPWRPCAACQSATIDRAAGSVRPVSDSGQCQRTPRRLLGVNQIPPHFSFTLAAPPDSGKRPPPSASRAGSVRACLSGKPSAPSAFDLSQAAPASVSPPPFASLSGKPSAVRPCAAFRFRPVSDSGKHRPRRKCAAGFRPMSANAAPVYPATVCRVPLPACQQSGEHRNAATIGSGDRATVGRKRCERSTFRRHHRQAVRQSIRQAVTPPEASGLSAVRPCAAQPFAPSGDRFRKRAFSRPCFLR